MCDLADVTPELKESVRRALMLLCDPAKCHQVASRPDPDDPNRSLLALIDELILSDDPADLERACAIVRAA